MYINILSDKHTRTPLHLYNIILREKFNQVVNYNYTEININNVGNRCT